MMDVGGDGKYEVERNNGVDEDEIGVWKEECNSETHLLLLLLLLICCVALLSIFSFSLRRQLTFPLSSHGDRWQIRDFHCFLFFELAPTPYLPPSFCRICVECLFCFILSTATPMVITTGMIEAAVTLNCYGERMLTLRPMSWEGNIY
ncbi:hypothetical protein, unlikely [Trypanosoma congolense IL3000]|uniref:Uncharacterized protein n=1 Tax=Trypanosoma congolense (strain IL3000) TaxID=1068625 RepID=F9WAJ1_TRYCI|nr:hypothetical protein, unlikely [Trypanosoma congolense IL3000]